MYLKQMATRLMMEHIDILRNESVAESALSDVLFGSSDHFDLTELVEQFTNSDKNIAEKANSWLGNERNQSISADEIVQALGQPKIQELAKRLGIAERRTSEGLSAMLPQLIDAASRDGRLFYEATKSARKPTSNRLFEAVSSLLR